MVDLSYDDLDRLHDRHLVRVRLGLHAVLDLLNSNLAMTHPQIRITSSAVHSTAPWWSEITTMTATASAVTTASIVSTGTSVVLIK